MQIQNEIEQCFESVYDAYRAGVQACGGFKKVASGLWPHKPAQEAARELADALNRDRPRKLDPEECAQLLRMFREIGFHSTKHFIDKDAGYDKTGPTDPQVQEDKLASAISDLARLAGHLLKEAETLQQRKGSATVTSIAGK